MSDANRQDLEADEREAAESAAVEATPAETIEATPEAAEATPAEPAAVEGKKPGRIQQLVAEYGAIALVVHLTLFGLTLGGFAIAISAGFETEGAGEEAGVWAAAYVASQLTKPIRLPLVFVLTPIVAALWHRLRGTTPPPKA